VSQKVPMVSARHLRRSMVILSREDECRELCARMAPQRWEPEISGPSPRLDISTTLPLISRQEVSDL
jgi:hypothetical protein